MAFSMEKVYFRKQNNSLKSQFLKRHPPVYLNFYLKSTSWVNRLLHWNLFLPGSSPFKLPCLLEYLCHLLPISRFFVRVAVFHAIPEDSGSTLGRKERKIHRKKKSQKAKYAGETLHAYDTVFFTWLCQTWKALVVKNEHSPWCLTECNPGTELPKGSFSCRVPLLKSGKVHKSDTIAWCLFANTIWRGCGQLAFAF